MTLKYQLVIVKRETRVHDYADILSDHAFCPIMIINAVHIYVHKNAHLLSYRGGWHRFGRDVNAEINVQSTSIFIGCFLGILKNTGLTKICPT